MKKIPAQGFVAPQESKTSPLFDSKIVKNTASDFPLIDSVICEKNNSIAIPVKGKIKPILSNSIKCGKEIKQTIPEKVHNRNVEKKNMKRMDGSGLLILLLLLLGLTMIIAGGWIFVIGIYAASWWIILCGLALVFLGLVPFLGLIGFMAGDRNKNVPAYQYKEK